MKLMRRFKFQAILRGRLSWLSLHYTIVSTYWKDASSLLKIQLAEIEELRAKLQEQAIRDPLTNVYNRRYMAEFLDQETARAIRENYPISIVIMDMDHF